MHGKPGLRSGLLLARLSSRLSDRCRYPPKTMIQFVLHSSGHEHRRGAYTAQNWLQIIEQLYSKGTFSLTSAKVFDNEYKQAVSAYHSIGPTLEFASVGKQIDPNQWQDAGWLCTHIESSSEIFSFRGTDEPLQHCEYSIYTGVHIVESHCIYPIGRLAPVLDAFLKQTMKIDEHWLEFDNVFMTHDTYKTRRYGG